MARKLTLTALIVLALLVLVAANIALTVSLPLWACVPIWIAMAFNGHMAADAVGRVWGYNGDESESV